MEKQPLHLPDESAIRQWLCRQLAECLALPLESINARSTFARHGLDSARLTVLAKDLATFSGRPVAATDLWHHPTPQDLARHLGGEATTVPPKASRAPSPRHHEEPVAVTGMACRLPGASNPDSFWKLLCAGEHAIREVPAERWDMEEYFDPDPKTSGRTHTRWAGLLDQVDGFDPLFFGISPYEAEHMDPQQRLMLELAWEALEDGGYSPESLSGSPAGVFVGAVWHDYEHLLPGMDALHLHSATGLSNNLLANRISFSLGLRGPSLTLDTACSSSAVAIHMAYQSLRQGEADLALAGGVNLILSPTTMVALAKFGGLAPDDRLKAFDAEADGFVRGEGGGLVVLKPLSKALADGDRIYCLLRGSAINNDGATNGLTAPSPAAQEELLCTAWSRAGIDPQSAFYVEAHGTGTHLGDPIEARALGAVLGAGRDSESPLRIGSVKTNIGHLEGAAGIAGMIKTSLALHRRQVPRSLNFNTPNPHIPFSELGLKVQEEQAPWPSEAAPYAGVSSFGWGGTNCHLVLAGAETRFNDPPPPRRFRDPAENSHGVVFVFSPQGGQWLGMGRNLLATEPAFGNALRRFDRAFQEVAQWSLLERLTADAAQPTWQRVDTVQPLIVAVQLGVVAVFESWGVRPAAVVGHSLGEIPAAHVAGALSTEEAALLLHHYSELQATTDDEGGMAILGLPPENVKERLNGRVSLAAFNSPQSTVVAGDRDALDELIETLTQEGLFARRVEVNVAAHSPRIDAIASQLLQSLQDISPRPTALPVFSTLEAREVAGTELGASYWPRNLRQPVRFKETISSLIDAGHRTFVEVNPHPILAPCLQQILSHHQVSGTVIPALLRGEDESQSLRRVLSQLEDLDLAGKALEDEPLEAHLLTLSGHTPEALRERAKALLAHTEEEVTVSDLASTLAQRRGHHEHRLAFTAGSLAEAGEVLEDYLAEESIPGLTYGVHRVESPRRIAFIFPGQGSQWLGMGRDLYRREPIFRQAFDRVSRAMEEELPDRTLVAELFSREEENRFERVDIVQPMIFGIQVALAELWKSWGVEPTAVVGHSMGEVAATCVAGALSLEDAVRVICRRSRLLQRSAPQGAMLLVELTLEEAQEILQGRQEHISIAVSNSPRSTVLSGDRGVLARLMVELEAKQVFCRWVKVNVASHSPQMDSLLPELQSRLEGITPQTPSLPVESTVGGEGSVDFGVEYWVRNLRQPVLFGQAIEKLLAAGCNTFLEMSPHPILLPSVEQVVAAGSKESDTEILPSLRRQEDGRSTLLQSLGTLYTLGHPVDWAGVFPRGGKPLSLPTYPWQRERCWFDAPAPRQQSLAPQTRVGHPLLGEPFTSAVHPDVRFWQLDLQHRDHPWLAEHVVGGAFVISSTVYLEMALAAASKAFKDGASVLTDLTFEQALVLPPTGSQTIQLVITSPPGPRSPHFEVYSRQAMEDGEHWVGHAAGSMRRGMPTWPRPTDVDKVRQRCPHQVEGQTFYAALAQRGLSYGPSWRGVERIWQGKGEALGRIGLPFEAGSSNHYHLHPALLDACLQVLLACLEESADSSPMLVVGIEHFALFAPPQGAVYSHAVAWPANEAGEVHRIDLRVTGEDGLPVAELRGIELRRAVRDEAPAEHLETPQAEATDSLYAALEAQPPGPQREALLRRAVREHVAHVLRLKPSRVSDDRPLSTLGLTSLMTLELRNRLDRALGLTLSATLIWNYPTVDELVPYLAECIGLSLTETPERPEPSPVSGDDPADGLELELLEELNVLEDLLLTGAAQ